MLKGRASEGRSLGQHNSAMLSSEARDRLVPGGVYTCCSLPIPIWTFGKLISEAGFRPRLVAKRSIVIEDLLILRIEIAIAARTRL